MMWTDDTYGDGTGTFANDDGFLVVYGEEVNRAEVPRKQMLDEVCPNCACGDIEIIIRYCTVTNGPCKEGLATVARCTECDLVSSPLIVGC